MNWRMTCIMFSNQVTFNESRSASPPQPSQIKCSSFQSAGDVADVVSGLTRSLPQLEQLHLSNTGLKGNLGCIYSADSVLHTLGVSRNPGIKVRIK
jgi:hypothetical protein